jgi:hypothetical protein
VRAEDEVRRRAASLYNHYERVSVAAQEGGLRDGDADMAVTSAVVRFALEVERQMERLFVQLALGNRQLPGVRPIVGFRSADVLHQHIRQGRQYADWLPYESNTLARANRFFSGGRPFSSMSKQGTGALRELSAIRNVLAHDSKHARRSFDSKVLASRQVPTYERPVGRYLRGVGAGTQTRLEQHLASAVAAFEELV